jgi:hypothetical protein
MNDKIKTVTHEGNVYQIGKDYVFFDEISGMSFFDELKSINKHTTLPFDGIHARYKHIKNRPLENIGTITPAPIELVDNGAYMFDFKDETCIGFYELSQEAFFDRHDGGKQIAKLSFCTNIRLMTVESK